MPHPSSSSQWPRLQGGTSRLSCRVSFCLAIHAPPRLLLGLTQASARSRLRALLFSWRQRSLAASSDSSAVSSWPVPPRRANAGLHDGRGDALDGVAEPAAARLGGVTGAEEVVGLTYAAGSLGSRPELLEAVADLPLLPALTFLRVLTAGSVSSPCGGTGGTGRVGGGSGP